LRRLLVQTPAFFLKAVSHGWLATGMFIWAFVAAYGGRQLALSDIFGGSFINTNNWMFDIGNGSGGWDNDDLEPGF
jgi:hypothetical protein